MSGTKDYEFVVETSHKPRLDKFLAEKDIDITRSQLQRLIHEGNITINGDSCRPSRKLALDDVVHVVVPPAVDCTILAQDIPLDVLYEDEHLIVVNKPAGLVVHPAPGHPDGTLVNALLYHCKDLSGIGGMTRPGIVHRLDKGTTGVMVATKTDRCHNGLVALFQARDLQREYVALVSPVPKENQGTIDTRYGRHPRDRKKFAVLGPWTEPESEPEPESEIEPEQKRGSTKVAGRELGRSRGKRAITQYRIVEQWGQVAMIACRLQTGRTHQIRVHMANSGAPLLGDPMYGRKYTREPVVSFARGLTRQALHARSLAFAHPVTGALVACEAAMPHDMQSIVTTLRGEFQASL